MHLFAANIDKNLHFSKMIDRKPLGDTYGRLDLIVHYVQFNPSRFDRSNIAKQNLSQTPNVVCGGSELWIYMVMSKNAFQRLLH